PRRYYDYIPEYELLHQVSTVGSWILGAGLFMAAGVLLWSMFRGEKASPNPWGAATLEWTHTGRRPDPHNFHRTPLVTRGPYDFHLAHEVFGTGDGSGDGSSAGAPAPPAAVRPH